MKAQSKVQTACDITIGVDHGSLRLQFPSRHSPLWEALDGKLLKGKPKYLPLGRHGYKDNPEDWKRASALAAQMEADLDHPEWEKLFDPTLAKYGIGGGKYAKLADVLQYLQWKETKVEPSTFADRYLRRYSNIIKGLKWDKKSRSFSATGNDISSLPANRLSAEKLLLSPYNKAAIVDTIRALNEAFDRGQSTGMIKNAQNPYRNLHLEVVENPKEKYTSAIGVDGEILEWWQLQDSRQEEECETDVRFFTKNERDIIVRAFYESDKQNERKAAPLIEFLFLTGCRPGEAFALRWGDIFFDRGYIRFSKSYATSIKSTKRTKTKEIRMFRITPKIASLLSNIRKSQSSVDLVFPQVGGQTHSNSSHSLIWLGKVDKKEVNGKSYEYHYPGVVTRLVSEGKISQYLAPYHTRHTYITLTAHANKSDTSALLLLAHACGNSVEIIVKHYLGFDKDIHLVEV
ncbi:MAG: tyrosine-type recombinase/integrase [Microcoleus sp. PH2017_13_LAR_U_A]|uniref:site-specific integrase n=1 Tax=Microcoleus sp. PH2017_13_LAR_U_A TaxID=2798824 RepID=UPI001D1B3D34|nr:site-specific integrase [Microcoleus sp. PH2017_13_LAR_U_A]MCC3476471.1 tyrosine-type recombinase/integrase [Microcoleus sp. PH2017_13_LAR_U_A]